METEDGFVIILTGYPLSVVIKSLFADNGHDTGFFVDVVDCLDQFVLGENFEGRLGIGISEFLGIQKIQVFRVYTSFFDCVAESNLCWGLEVENDTHQGGFGVVENKMIGCFPLGMGYVERLL